ncbi:MAG: hypothetical protein HOP23_11795 [Methylococcaceae bacterium]|nr:hypothetical protein [Methylococcaceae bacterium]
MDTLLPHIIDAARYAPSPHNTQPWTFQPLDNGLDFYVNEQRLLAVADPQAHDTLHAFGTLLENSLLTLAHLGYTANYQLSRSMDWKLPIIQLRWQPLKSTCSDSHLYRMIPLRRTSRLPYYSEAVAPLLIETMHGAIGSTCKLYTLTNQDAITEIRSLVALATESLMTDNNMAEELYRWLRFSPRDPRWFKDGLNAACLGWKSWESAIAAVALQPSVLNGLKRLGLYQWFFSDINQYAPPAPAVCLLTVKGNETDQRIEAGRNLQRIWLIAASHGFHTHPLSAAIDSDLTRSRVYDLFKVAPGEYPVCLFRLGRSAVPAGSYRLPVDELFRL